MGEGPVKQRLIRVLVYEGTPQFIAGALQTRGVKGSHTVRGGIIREAIVGDFLETVISLDADDGPRDTHNSGTDLGTQG
jgi:hypothetical protein